MGLFTLKDINRISWEYTPRQHLNYKLSWFWSEKHRILCFILWTHISSDIDEFSLGIIEIYIERDVGILHPESLWLLIFKHKKHTTTIAERLAVHESPCMFVPCPSHFQEPITTISWHSAMLVSFFPEKSSRNQDDNKNDNGETRYLHKTKCIVILRSCKSFYFDFHELFL